MSNDKIDGQAKPQGFQFVGGVNLLPIDGLLSQEKMGALMQCYDAANQGDADCQYRLGTDLLLGGHDLHQDNNVAWVWLKKAADQGHVDAMRLVVNRRTSDYICCPQCRSTSSTSLTQIQLMGGQGIPGNKWKHAIPKKWPLALPTILLIVSVMMDLKYESGITLMVTFFCAIGMLVAQVHRAAIYPAKLRRLSGLSVCRECGEIYEPVRHEAGDRK